MKLEAAEDDMLSNNMIKSHNLTVPLGTDSEQSYGEPLGPFVIKTETTAAFAGQMRIVHTVWKLRKFSLTAFPQKFREIN